ncbi:MAG: cyclic nucleotide-binding domain-containing protein [Pseudomonadota bacterium]
MTQFIDAFALAGTVGVSFYLSSYFLLQAGYIRGSGFAYAWMNLAAASFVLVSLFANFNLYSAIIQVSWILISVFGLTRLFLRSRAVKFSPEEADFVQDKLAHMPRINARQFLNAGHWLDVAEETVLIEEGAPSTALFYLKSGAARAETEGRVLAHVAAGSLLGEITVLSDEPATARVVACPGTRLFRMSRTALRALVDKDPELRDQVHVALTLDTRSKMMAVNQATKDEQRRSELVLGEPSRNATPEA